MALVSLIQKTHLDPPTRSHENCRSEAKHGIFSLWLNLSDGEVEGLRNTLIPGERETHRDLERGLFFYSRPLCASRAHFGDKSWREAKGELLDEEGDTPSILPGESVEEPTLLRLPSSKSGEWLKGGEKNKTKQKGYVLQAVGTLSVAGVSLKHC